MEKYEDEVDPLARVQVCLVFVYFAILIRRLLFEEEKKTHTYISGTCVIIMAWVCHLSYKPHPHHGTDESSYQAPHFVSARINFFFLSG